MSNFLPFALPDIGEDEINEVVSSLRSGWLTTGPKAKQFEKEFTEYFGGDAETILVNSATSGLHLALDAIGIKTHDEVITTPYTFTATAEVIRYFDANPVFVDIDPSTFNIDPAKIEAAITPKTKAIMPVHFAGLACDMTSILKIAKKHNLKVIEDAAHALPATYNGNKVGTLESDITVFSFYATKTLTTGEGGMIVTKNPELAKHCRLMRFHGISRDVFDRHVSTKPAWFYEVIAPGFKYNMTDIAASIGIHQLRRISEMHKKREKIALTYDSSLNDLPIILPPHAPHQDLHSWYFYVIRLLPKANINHEKFIELMTKKGIGCMAHYIPLHIQPFWRDRYNLKPNDFPCALANFESAVSLPIYSKMTETDTLRVINAAKEILG